MTYFLGWCPRAKYDRRIEALTYSTRDTAGLVYKPGHLILPVHCGGYYIIQA